MVIKSEMPHFFYDDENSDGIEALNDYFLSWTIRCAVDYTDKNKKVQEYAAKILTFLIFKDNSDEQKALPENIKYLRVDTVKQIMSIDLIAEVDLYNNGAFEKYVLVFENKQYTNVHDDQLVKYKKSIDEYYSNINNGKTDYKRKFIFLTGHDEVPSVDVKACIDAGFKFFAFQELRYCFDADTKTGNYLFDEFWFRYFFYDKGIDNEPSAPLSKKFI